MLTSVVYTVMCKITAWAVAYYLRTGHGDAYRKDSNVAVPRFFCVLPQPFES